MKGDVIIQRLDRVVTREIVGETLLVPLRADSTDMRHIFALNPVAAAIWNAIDGVTPVQSLVDSVCERFAIDQASAERDIFAFIEELIQAGLVREA